MDWLSDEEMGKKPTNNTGEFNTNSISEEDFLRDLREQPERFGDNDTGPQDVPGGDPGPPGGYPPPPGMSDATSDPSGMPPLPGGDPMGPGMDDEAARRKARYTSKFLVGMMDTGISNSCKILARAESAKPYQADPDEKKDLVEVWTEYLKTTGGDIPPGVLAFMTTFVVYAPKAGQAYMDRNMQRNLDEKDSKIRKLEKQLQELKKKAA